MEASLIDHPRSLFRAGIAPFDRQEVDYVGNEVPWK